MSGVASRSNRAPGRAGRSLSVSAVFGAMKAAGESRRNRHDDRRDEEDQRSRHPHHDAGDDLVVERREATDARDLLVDWIQDPPGQGERGGDDRVRDVGEQQRRRDRPRGPVRRERPRPDDRPPEQQRPGDERDVFHAVPERHLQRELVGARHVPAPHRRGHRRQSDARVRQAVRAASQRRPGEERAERVANEPARQSAQHRARLERPAG